MDWVFIGHAYRDNLRHSRSWFVFRAPLQRKPAVCLKRIMGNCGILAGTAILAVLVFLVEEGCKLVGVF